MALCRFAPLFCGLEPSLSMASRFIRRWELRVWESNSPNFFQKQKCPSWNRYIPESGGAGLL